MTRILIADDDISTRGFLAAALQKSGYETVACADGLEAWQSFSAAPDTFSLLVTDIVMPGMDGLELSSRVRALRPDMHILYITGFAAMAGDAQDAKVIAKPFHLGSLTQEIDRLLNQSD